MLPNPSLNFFFIVFDDRDARVRESVVMPGVGIAGGRTARVDRTLASRNCRDSLEKELALLGSMIDR